MNKVVARILATRGEPGAVSVRAAKTGKDEKQIHYIEHSSGALCGKQHGDWYGVAPPNPSSRQLCHECRILCMKLWARVEGWK